MSDRTAESMRKEIEPFEDYVPDHLVERWTEQPAEVNTDVGQYARAKFDDKAEALIREARSARYAPNSREIHVGRGIVESLKNPGSLVEGFNDTLILLEQVDTGFNPAFSTYKDGSRDPEETILEWYLRDGETPDQLSAQLRRGYDIEMQIAKTLTTITGTMKNEELTLKEAREAIAGSVENLVDYLAEDSARIAEAAQTRADKAIRRDYEKNPEAYETRALEDAEVAGVDIKYGNKTQE